MNSPKLGTFSMRQTLALSYARGSRTVAPSRRESGGSRSDRHTERVISRSGHDSPLERRAAPPGQEEQPLARMRCGMRTLRTRATWPLARLSVFRWGVRMEVAVPLVRRFAPAWEARFDELAPVQPVGFGRSRHGHCIRFLVADSKTEWAICGTQQISRALDEIERAGGLVARARVRVRRFEPYVEMPWGPPIRR